MIKRKMKASKGANYKNKTDYIGLSKSVLLLHEMKKKKNPNLSINLFKKK